MGKGVGLYQPKITSLGKDIEQLETQQRKGSIS
jgi:hypothetical protein